MILSRRKMRNWTGAYGFGLSYGLKTSYFRVEADLTFRLNNEFEGENVRATIANHSLMINGFYDMPIGTTLVPYIGVGFGLSRLKWADYDYDPYDGIYDKTVDSYKKFAYAVSAGVAYNVDEFMAIDLGYTYTQLADIEEDHEVILKIKTSEIKLGVRQTF